MMRHPGPWSPKRRPAFPGARLVPGLLMLTLVACGDSSLNGPGSDLDPWEDSDFEIREGDVGAVVRALGLARV